MAAFLPAHLKMNRSTPHDRTIGQKEIMPRQPSVIARLMGIDAIPMRPATIIIHAQGETSSNLESPPPRTAAAAEIKVISPPFRPQAKCSLPLLSYRSRAGGDSKRCLKKMRPRSRQRHPQEDLLQKIKEDFQCWQASKTVAVLGNNSKHLDGRCIQIVAQENLRREKMARYGYANDKLVSQNQNIEAGKEAKPEEKKVITVLRSAKFRDIEEGHTTTSNRSSSTSGKLPSPAAQIVLLKPPSHDGELLFELSKVKRDDSMEQFLHNVKDRLHKELKVSKCRGDLSSLTWETENIAAQTVTTDLGKRLLSRSEAFRKRNHIATTGAKQHAASPEHITKSILARRPKKTTETVSPNRDEEESVDSFPIRTRERVRSLTDITLTEQSCTSECLMTNNKNVDSDILSQRKLVRSFSAPAESGGLSRTWLFSDQSAGSRKHEPSDIASETMTSGTSGFSFKETVSNLRHSFGFRRKLFGRRKKKKPSFEELYPQLAIGMSPSPSESFRLYSIPQANFAELPPSPVSPLEVAGHSCRHFFSDLNCSLPELSPKCPSEYEAPASELSFGTEITVETACNQDKAYIREVLIASGLYDDGSLENKVNARVDSMARPIGDYIFEEVEDVYYYRDKNADHDNSSGGNATDHRMLFDLANEALHLLAQGGGKTGSSVGQWVMDSTGVSRGRKLVDDVWQQVQTLRNPQMQEMQTIDSMVAFQVRKSVWAEVLHEDVYVVGRKIERAIFDKLIEDLLVEVFIT